MSPAFEDVITVVEVVDIPFLLVSGKLVAIDQITSVVPSHKHGGAAAMVFLKGVNQALLIEHSVKDFAVAIEAYNET